MDGESEDDFEGDPEDLGPEAFRNLGKAELKVVRNY